MSDVAYRSQSPIAPSLPPVEPSESAAVEPALDELVQLLKLFSDSNRLRILYALLQKDEMHVRALCELLNQSQPAVSHHLGLLRDAGLLGRRREGKHNFYSLISDRIGWLAEVIHGKLCPDRRPVRIGNLRITYDPS